MKKPGTSKTTLRTSILVLAVVIAVFTAFPAIASAGDIDFRYYCGTGYCTSELTLPNGVTQPATDIVAITVANKSTVTGTLSFASPPATAVTQTGEFKFANPGGTFTITGTLPDGTPFTITGSFLAGGQGSQQTVAGGAYNNRYFSSPVQFTSISSSLLLYLGLEGTKGYGTGTLTDNYFLDVLDTLWLKQVNLDFTPAACVPPPNTTMVGWYTFDDPNGSTKAENLASGNAGAVSTGAMFVPGLIGNALHFDGSTTYVDTPSSIVTNFGPGVTTTQACTGDDSTCAGDFSIDVWIKLPTDLDNSVKTILDKRSGSAPNIRGYSFALSYKRLILQLADGGPNGGYTNYASVPIDTLTDGNWHHIAVSVTRTLPNGIRWYHNGVALLGQEINPTDRQGSLINNSPLRIGANTADSAFDNFFRGDMDELQIFNRALSATEIGSIYAAGAAGQCKP